MYFYLFHASYTFLQLITYVTYRKILSDSFGLHYRKGNSKEHCFDFLLIWFKVSLDFSSTLLIKITVVWSKCHPPCWPFLGFHISKPQNFQRSAPARSKRDSASLWNKNKMIFSPRRPYCAAKMCAVIKFKASTNCKRTKAFHE